MYTVASFPADDSVAMVHSNWFVDSERVRWPRMTTFAHHQWLLLHGDELPSDTPIHDFLKIFHSDTFHLLVTHFRLPPRCNHVLEKVRRWIQGVVKRNRALEYSSRKRLVHFSNVHDLDFLIKCRQIPVLRNLRSLEEIAGSLQCYTLCYSPKNAVRYTSAFWDIHFKYRASAKAVVTDPRDRGRRITK